ncbi:serine/threonine-protein kinase [Stieleria varia]|uniref:non-specific serine/threonine protein kinase n=1 Tax=Stieleria varia TaxID=2528005 RepID=A0A5C6ASM2_9BACT|nr:serine/threonine-protein kinase [Stieleria varia]TWU02481.1 Serine/threonine-protein kinase PknL [Stieleria varia]
MVAFHSNRIQRATNPDQHCSTQTLEQLLDETLAESEATDAHHHLDVCSKCRVALESIAGEASLWSHTRTVLLDSGPINHAEQSPLRHRTDAHTPSETWLRGFLQPGPANCLGLLDRYEIHRVIGTGGMGVVVSAVDPKLNRPVAIKLLAPHLSGLGTARQRFARESRAVAAVVHTAIMPIYGINDETDVPYLVMPLVSGGNLQQRIDRDGPLPLDDVIAIGVQIADGLAAAHANGVIHRDIKPGNVLLEENSPRVIISDFGLARALDDATVTVSGMIAGTPQYMSPEQATGERADHRSDLFSLGSVLYAMATGRPPFRAESPVAVLRKIADADATPPSDLRDELPGWFDRLVAMFLEKDPSRRLENASQAYDLLHEVQLHLRRPTANELPRVLQTENPSRNRHRFVIVALLMTALLVGAVAAWFPTKQVDASLPTDSADTEIVASKPKKPTTLPLDTNWRWSSFEQIAQDMDESLTDLEQMLQVQPPSPTGVKSDD